MVLLYHLFAYSMVHGQWSGIATLALWLTTPLWCGVDLFFALSGFLITGILLDTKYDPRYFRNFYARRALRILPLYYLILLVVLFCYPNSGRYAVLVLLFLCNMAPLFGAPMLNGALWSLSVEEHFYLFWPLLVRRLRLRHVATAALAVCLIEPIFRGTMYGRFVTANVYVYTWFRLDGLASGALVACFLRSRHFSVRNADRWSASMMAGAVALLIACAPFGILQHTTPFGAALQFVPGNLIFGSAVLYAVAHAGSRSVVPLRAPFLRVCANLSYCMYLIHCILMNGYDALLKKMGLPAASSSFGPLVLRAAIVLSVCFAFGAVSRKTIELPALRLKRLFSPARPREVLRAAVSA
jgi:peptidoglycan/LPS O-acetylase OafA/YrhL